jgi:hypothetical protein
MKDYSCYSRKQIKLSYNDFKGFRLVEVFQLYDKNDGTTKKEVRISSEEIVPHYYIWKCVFYYGQVVLEETLEQEIKKQLTLFNFKKYQTVQNIRRLKKIIRRDFYNDVKSNEYIKFISNAQVELHNERRTLHSLEVIIKDLKKDFKTAKQIPSYLHD